MAYEIEKENIADKGMKCFVCNKTPANFRATFKEDIMVMNVCVCDNCYKLGPSAIISAVEAPPVKDPYLFLQKVLYNGH